MRLSLLLSLFALFASPAFAHGGGPHLKGTVAVIAADHLTVRESNGKERDARITPATTFARGDGPGKQEDLKQGDRVVVHTRKLGNALEAVEIRYGSAASPSH